MIKKKSLKNLKPVKRGEIRNPAGRPPKARCIPDILKLIGDEIDSRSGLPNIEALMRIVYKKALRGIPWAVSFVAERTEGRVAQYIGLAKSQKPESYLTDEQKAKVADMLDGDPDGTAGIPYQNQNQIKELTE